MRCPDCQRVLGRVIGDPTALRCSICEADYRLELTPRQKDALEALGALARAGETASAQAVANRLSVSRQAATKLLSELERLGLAHDEPVMVRSGRWRVVSE